MNDNLRRSLRTGIQVILGVLATGGLTKVWESFNTTHTVDATVQVVAGLICVMIVAWAQNELEDQFGGGLLVPTDRVVGDAVLHTGIGEKQLDSGHLSKTARTALLAAPSVSTRVAGSTETSFPQ